MASGVVTSSWPDRTCHLPFLDGHAALQPCGGVIDTAKSNRSKRYALASELRLLFTRPHAPPESPTQMIVSVVFIERYLALLSVLTR